MTDRWHSLKSGELCLKAHPVNISLRYFGARFKQDRWPRQERGDRYNLINFLLNRIRPENLPPLNSPADDVLQSTGCVDACFSGHGRYIS